MYLHLTILFFQLKYAAREQNAAPKATRDYLSLFHVKHISTLYAFAPIVRREQRGADISELVDTKLS
jgi:hypothetical protein